MIKCDAHIPCIYFSSDIPVSRHGFLFRSTLGETFISLPKHPWRDIDFPSGIPLATHYFSSAVRLARHVFLVRSTLRETFVWGRTRIRKARKDPQGFTRIHKDTPKHCLLCGITPRRSYKQVTNIVLALMRALTRALIPEHQTIEINQSVFFVNSY